MEWPVKAEETPRTASKTPWSITLDRVVLLTAVAFGVLVSAPRLGPGLPMGVDSSSHLSKVMLVTDSIVRYGKIPSWSPDWYGGTPFLLLYAPLSYILTGVLGVLAGPVLAYKLVDLIFYVAAPLAVYWLARDFGLDRLESASAALLFSTVPEVVENYVFFDRFPTTISIVVVCVFLISFKRLLSGSTVRWVIVPSLLLATVVLTHHLSGLIAVFIACVYVMTTIPNRQAALRHIGLGAGAIVGGLGLASFWLVPYSVALTILPKNEFYNRNVIFPFLRLTYFGKDVTVALLGVAQFVLAVIGLQILMNKIYHTGQRLKAVYLILLLMAGMSSYEIAELKNFEILKWIGMAIVALAFVVFLTELVQRRIHKGLLRSTANYQFALLWFVLFLWLGLGYYALPPVWFDPMKEVWMKLDVYRFWLYLAVPMTLLAGVGLVRTARVASRRGRYLAILLIVLIGVPVFVGPAVKIWMTNTYPVNPHLPYSAANAEVPSEIVDYFRSEKSDGRILAVKCPLWIYLLPRIVGKPTIDGWYPQSKLLTRLLNATSDYRIDDLESAKSDEDRIRVWRMLIDDKEILGIEWVMIGNLNQTQKRLLLENSGFSHVLTVSYEDSDIAVYKSTEEVSLVEVSPPGAFQVVMTRLSPDHIRLTLAQDCGCRGETARVQIREAYFPTWVASAEGKPVSLERDDEGYIQFTAKSWMKTVDITQQSDPELSTLSSAVSLVTLICLLIVIVRRPRHDAE
jgi:hypothetical protein